MQGTFIIFISSPKYDYDSTFWTLSKYLEFSSVRLLCQTGALCSRTGLMNVMYMIFKSDFLLVEYIKGRWIKAECTELAEGQASSSPIVWAWQTRLGSKSRPALAWAQQDLRYPCLAWAWTNLRAGLATGLENMEFPTWTNFYSFGPIWTHLDPYWQFFSLQLG